MQTTSAEVIEMIDLADIVPGNNDRKVFDPAKIEELATSIKAHGLIQPITVRPIGKLYQIVAGERRFRASDAAGLEQVPCIVRELTDDQAAEIMLSENTARANLNPIEEANAYRLRVEVYGWSVERVAEVAGVSEEMVRSRLRLLALTAEIQHLVASGQLPLGCAMIAAQLDANRQRIAVREYSNSPSMTVADFRRLVNDLLAQQATDSLLGDFELMAMTMPAQTEAKRWTKADELRAIDDAGALPAAFGPEMNTATVIRRYIADLTAAGCRNEAAAVAALYKALLSNNLVKLPNFTVGPAND